jgi:PAS domain S-box-containing protein
MFGFAQRDLTGLDVSALVPEQLRERHRGLVAGFDPDSTGAHLMGRDRQVHARRRGGTVFPAEVTLTAVPSPQRALVCATVRDITTRRRLEDQLVQKSLHDPLTGLGNRLMLTDRLAQVLARQQRHGGLVAVLMRQNRFDRRPPRIRHRRRVQPVPTPRVGRA